MFLTPGRKYVRLLHPDCGWVKRSTTRGAGLIQNGTIRPRHAQEPSHNSWRKVLLDFADNIVVAVLHDIKNQCFSDCLSLFSERVTKVGFEETFQREVDKHSEQHERDREKSCIPCR